MKDRIEGWGMREIGGMRAIGGELVPFGEKIGCEKAGCRSSYHDPAARNYYYVPEEGTTVDLIVSYRDEDGDPRETWGVYRGGEKIGEISLLTERDRHTRAWFDRNKEDEEEEDGEESDPFDSLRRGGEEYEPLPPGWKIGGQE